MNVHGRDLEIELDMQQHELDSASRGSGIVGIDDTTLDWKSGAEFVWCSGRQVACLSKQFQQFYCMSWGYLDIVLMFRWRSQNN